MGRISWPSEEAHQAALKQLRAAESAFDLSGVVSPPAGQAETSADDIATAQAAAAKQKADLIAAGWTPPTEAGVAAPVTTSPEIPSGLPEATNAFSGYAGT